MGPRLTRLSRSTLDFPPAQAALEEPNGLLAVGGDLSVARLLQAYRNGIFPWYDSDAGPILWWSPDPRGVIDPSRLLVSRSLRQRLKRGDYRCTVDTGFEDVIRCCSAPRAYASGTWVTREMRDAYVALHRAGYAHSVETWLGDVLVGGLYGVSLGRIFFGESMFSTRSDASKVALVHLARQLVRWDFPLIDCQLLNPHLVSLGAVALERSAFLDVLRDNLRHPTRRGSWRFD